MSGLVSSIGCYLRQVQIHRQLNLDETAASVPLHCTCGTMPKPPVPPLTSDESDSAFAILFGITASESSNLHKRFTSMLRSGRKCTNLRRAVRRVLSDPRTAPYFLSTRMLEMSRATMTTMVNRIMDTETQGRSREDADRLVREWKATLGSPGSWVESHTTDACEPGSKVFVVAPATSATTAKLQVTQTLQLDMATADGSESGKRKD